MRNICSINHAPLKFIHTTGIQNLVTAVQSGMVPPEQAVTMFHAVGRAIDIYMKAVPSDAALIGLRRSISRLPVQGNIDDKTQKRIPYLLAELIMFEDDVELALRIARKIRSVGHMALLGVATVAHLEAPFDLGAEWRWIPPGPFEMGSRDDDQYADDIEKPLLSVMTGGFFMLDHPATNAEFRNYPRHTQMSLGRSVEYDFFGDDQPAVCIGTLYKDDYAKWLGEEVSKRTGHSVIGRFPTEAEWEKAAKGPDGNEFITPATPEQAHFNAKVTRSVNHPEAYVNGYGLRDMIGNVWEYTSTPWGSQDSPVGCTPSDLVTRGGGYILNDPARLRAAYRDYAVDIGGVHFAGIRPVLIPAEVDE